MRGVLRFWWGLVTESFQGLEDIVGKGEFDCAIDVIPFEVHPTVGLSCPIDGGFVLFLEVGEEGVSVCFVSILHAEVIDDEGERKRFNGVCEEAWCVRRWVVASLFEMGKEGFIGDAASLWQSIHALADLC